MNKQRGYFPVMLDKQRHFRFTFSALGRLEDELGVKIPELAERIQKNPAGILGFKELLILFHIGLLHEQPDLTREQVDEFLMAASMEGRFNDVLQQCIEAFTFVTTGGGEKKQTAAQPKGQKHSRRHGGRK